MTGILAFVLAVGGGWFGLAKFFPEAAKAMGEALKLLREPWVQACIAVVALFGAYAYGYHAGRGVLDSVLADQKAVRTSLHCDTATPFRKCPESYTDALDRSAREVAAARDAEIDARLRDYVDALQSVEPQQERVGGCVIDAATAKLINGGRR